MFKFLKKKLAPKENPQQKIQTKNESRPPQRSKEELATVKGDIGEHKIDIQLSQLPKEYKFLNDIMIKNAKSKTGYSQIDHLVFSPYGIFVIETKNYQGTIYGGRDRKTWLVNGKFKFMNPFRQNYGHVEALKELVDPKHHASFISMISFTKRCTFKVEPELRKITSNDLIVYDIELSEFIHRKVSVNKLQHQEPFLTQQEITDIHNTIANANIEDPAIRAKHNERIQKGTASQDRANQTCADCGKPVSDKVKAYCLNNSKFEGKIYCFDCQKQYKG
ncbi:nuclease-related domain-containing protein [Aquibacillus sediminis]|uniref:nuclease-related domain-containing protein n=1 Tax=Aquibacillus sediminis TaxID=2574734 RepID=UPI0011088804|nr:nuclease-related domain-containing protein [Aquibacillus sediminis]